MRTGGKAKSIWSESRERSGTVFHRFALKQILFYARIFYAVHRTIRQTFSKAHSMGLRLSRDRFDKTVFSAKENTVHGKRTT